MTLERLTVERMGRNSFFILCLLVMSAVARAPLEALHGQEAAPAEILGEPPPEESQGSDREVLSGPRKQEHWKALPPEKRRELMAIQRRLETLPAEQRQKLFQRLRSMRPEERREFLKRAKQELSAADGIERDARHVRQEILREKLRRLPPAERERVRNLSPQELRRYFEERAVQRRQAIISRLPEARRREVEKLPPREQVKVLRGLQAVQAIRRTFQDPREVARLRQLPPQLRRELLRPARPGTPPPPKPDFLSDETWQRWLELKPYERIRVLRHLDEPRPPRPGAFRAAPKL